MEITFYKNNLNNKSYKISIDNFVDEFLKSKESEWYYMPEDTRINYFILNNNYGTHDRFSDEMWDKLFDTIWEKKSLKY
jgi:hypothetical protein